MKGRLWFDSRRQYWTVILELGRKPDGSRWTESKGGFAKKKDAQTYLDERTSEAVQGVFVPSNDLTVGEWCDRWLRDYAPLRAIDTTLTLRTSQVRLYIKPDLGAVKLQQLDKPMVQAAVTKWSKTLAASTTRQVASVLKMILKEAVEAGIIRRNPAANMALPKASRTEMRALDEGETRKLLELLKGDDLYLPVLIALSTGMRRGEILGLKWSAIDGNSLTVRETIAQNNAVHAPKTARGRRTIIIPATLVAALKEHKRAQREQRMAAGSWWKDTGYVFTRADGNPWTYNDISCRFTRLMQRSDMKLRFHDLRHTHASQLLQKGYSLNLVAERLGHDPTETLRTYAHVMPGQDALAAQMVDDLLASTGTP